MLCAHASVADVKCKLNEHYTTCGVKIKFMTEQHLGVIEQ